MTNHGSPRPPSSPPAGVRLHGGGAPGAERVLTTSALTFVRDLCRSFQGQVAALLDKRRELQLRLDGGARLGFLTETKDVRDSTWRGPPPASDLTDRRVEMTGPVDRKMIINALNSGANVFMADFEDATSPTFANLVEGQVNVMDAVNRTIQYTEPVSEKVYELKAPVATLMVRPRGLHLVEKHVDVDGQAMPASLFDFGLHFFHNARALVARQSGPYYYIPKLEGHHEARLWNDIFTQSERTLGLPVGTVRATVLIETLPAAFEMDEILYELREHSAGLNCGRWDYIYSFIKKRRNDPGAVLPDRALVTMEQPFLRAYTQLLVKTCHRRGVHAMGGMAAQIPVRGESGCQPGSSREGARRQAPRGKGRPRRYVGGSPSSRTHCAGGLRRAHAGVHQLHVSREDVTVAADELLSVPAGPRTVSGSATISGWGSSTSRRGSGERDAFRSTI